MTTGLALVVAGLGCEFIPDRKFSRVQSDLKLTIVETKRSTVAGSVDFGLELKNGGSESASACLGPSRSVWYKAGSGGGVSSDLVDHPGCQREFAIEAGRALAWSETLTELHLSKVVEVEVGVQIVNPRRCVNWGNCSAFDVRSNRAVIP
ncbi:MAG: hypothetical protein R2712_26445 [Vicinamibacterales bacterium]